MKTTCIGITRILALAGVTDFSWVDEEARWRGSEVHRMAELHDKGRLASCPERLDGYMHALCAFEEQTGFIPTHIEHKVQSKVLGIRGRIDRAGLMKGKRTIVDFKTSAINPAVGLQLVLGGHLLNGAWHQRIAVQLKPDGTYSMKTFPLISWHADLQTALACARIARWKLANKIAR
jgi:hypothetical protein